MASTTSELVANATENYQLIPGEITYFGAKNSFLNFGDHAFSNDGPIPDEALTALSNQKDQLKPGLALSVGASALISMMPYHNLQTIAVDYDSCVMNMLQLTTQAILDANSVDQAVSLIAERGTRFLHKSADDISHLLRREAHPLRLGEQHWTINFSKVQTALQDRRPAIAVSNVSGEQFIGSLIMAAEDFGNIRLFNPTNVHNHIATRDKMGFTQNLPFDDDVVILYSDTSHSGIADFEGQPMPYLKRFFTPSLDCYLDDTSPQAKRITRDSAR